MKERSFDEMIAYFNRRVTSMDINKDYKMELLGMVTALGVKHKKSAQKRRYTFGNGEFNLEAAYHDCKLVFDGITDDSFQEADTGLILYYANEIIYALHEALKGKDTNVPSKDTIYRQDAIDAVTSSVMEWDEIYAQDLNVRISEAIQQMPSAQPEREKGKWTKDCACEICGFKPWYEWDIHTLSFCPNCGADMR